jgi:hypothetical protein
MKGNDCCPECGATRWTPLWRSLLTRMAQVVECNSCSYRWVRPIRWSRRSEQQGEVG